MKLKKIRQKINTKEFEIKLLVTLILVTLLVLSFFFAGAIENFFHLNSNFGDNQTTFNKLSSSSYLVEYIDVGQGNSALVSLPDGKTILIDGGNVSEGKKVADFLRSRNVKAIDYLIASHADSDHIGGLVYVLENFEVKNIYRPFQIAGTGTNADNFEVYQDEDLADVYYMLQSSTNGKSKISRATSSVYKNFITSIYSETYEESGIVKSSNITVFYDGLKISGENYKLEFYSPLVRSENIKLSDYSNTNGYATMGYGATESNGNSAIFVISILGESFMFTGDAPFGTGSLKEVKSYGYEELDFINSLSDGELEFLSNISVYLAGHHGSANSSSETLLNVISPKFVVVSVARKNSYGHPAKEAMDRLNKYKTELDPILLTSKSGNISFGEVDGKLMYVLFAQTKEEDVAISWYLLGSIIFGFIEVFVIFIKSPKRKNPKIQLPPEGEVTI